MTCPDQIQVTIAFEAPVEKRSLAEQQDDIAAGIEKIPEVRSRGGKVIDYRVYEPDRVVIDHSIRPKLP